MYCEKCGAEISSEANFCPSCGEPVVKKVEGEAVSPSEPVSKSSINKMAIFVAAVVFVVVMTVVFIHNKKYAPQDDVVDADLMYSTVADLQADCDEAKRLSRNLRTSAAGESTYQDIEAHYLDKLLSFNDIVASDDEDSEFVYFVKKYDVSPVTQSETFENGLEIDREAGYFFYMDSHDFIYYVLVKDKTGKASCPDIEGVTGYYELYPACDEEIASLLGD